MSARPCPILMLLTALLLAGCGTTTADLSGPMWQEPRVVHPAAIPHQTLSVPEGMVFVDGPPATRCIRFLPGVYPLVAEDADYWYFGAPSALEFRAFKEGKFGDGHNSPGGLMLAKHPHPVPAAGYTDGAGSTKLAVWKLGQEFLQLEGKYWTRDF